MFIISVAVCLRPAPAHHLDRLGIATRGCVPSDLWRLCRAVALLPRILIPEHTVATDRVTYQAFTLLL